MKVFIDTVSPVWVIILFEDKKILAQKKLDILWKEFSLFLDQFLNFLKDNNLNLKDILWIVAVNWPGWFTWTRIISLIINTFNFVYWIKIQSIDYFELIERLGMDYPIIIKANRWEYLIKTSKTVIPTIIGNNDLIDWIYSWIWDQNDFENKNISLNIVNEYNNLIENFEFAGANIKMEPFYIKKPNIT